MILLLLLRNKNVFLTAFINLIKASNQKLSGCVLKCSFFIILKIDKIGTALFGSFEVPISAAKRMPVSGPRKGCLGLEWP